MSSAVETLAGLTYYRVEIDSFIIARKRTETLKVQVGNHCTVSSKVQANFYLHMYMLAFYNGPVLWVYYEGFWGSLLSTRHTLQSFEVSK